MKCSATLAILTMVLCTTANAENAHVVKVEETWELTVGEPNDSKNAPQVTMVMSPSGNTDSLHFAFEVNHRTQPSYSPGGMQVQTWYGEQHATTHHGTKTGRLAGTGEKVKWTQELSIADGKVQFEIKDGSSTSWSNFGGQGYLRSSVYTGQANLNSYRADVSIKESGIGFAGNRVSSLVLQRIQWTMSDGKIYQLNAPIDIDSDLDPWNDEEVVE